MSPDKQAALVILQFKYCVQFRTGPVRMDPDPRVKSEKWMTNAGPVQGSELGVLSGVSAGLVPFFQAAAVDRRILGHVSQRI